MRAANKNKKNKNLYELHHGINNKEIEKNGK
jgi:hypothetical protein